MNKRNYFFVIPLVLTLTFLMLGFSIQDDRSSRTPQVQTDLIEPTPNVFPFSVENFVDSMNGANDTTSLKNRGYAVYYRGTGPQGIAATWFQGNSGVFPAFNGPATGYVAANFQVVTSVNNIDSWLVLPALNVAIGDTLSFYERSTADATFLDSMRVMYNPTGATLPEDPNWVELGRFQNTNTGSWTERRYVAPSAGVTGRFAIRYAVVNGGPSGSNSDFVGVDYIRVLGAAGPPGLSGDYTIGVALFNTLTGKNLSFEKRTRTVTETILMNEYYAKPELFESVPHSININDDGSVEEFGGIDAPQSTPDKYVTYVYEQEYYVPVIGGQQYDGPLYHEFTEAERTLYNLGDGVGVYATITAAVADANLDGLTGPTRFLLLDATYPSETFPIIFDNVPGTSSVNTLTLLPAAGVTTLISGSPTNTQIFRVNESSYIIFDGRQNGVSNPGSMTIQNLTTTGTASHTIQFVNGSTHCVIEYCNVIGSAQGTAGPRTIDIATSVSNPSGNSDLRISNNNIEGNRSVIASSGSAANPNQNIIIENNIITNGSFAHIWLLGSTNSIVIRDNEFTTVGPGYNIAGVVLLIGSVGGTSTNEIYNNQIYGIQSTVTSTARGMTISASPGSTWNIYNNFFAFNEDNGTKTSIYAIASTGTNLYTVNIYYNTFSISGTHTGGAAGNVVSAGFVKQNTGATAEINYKNNVTLNTRDGGPGFHVGSFISNVTGVLDIDYNTSFSNGGANSFNAGWGGTIYNVLADYQAAATPHEANSKFKLTNFVSTTNLRLVAPSIGDLDLIGTPIPGITTDIDGDIRDLVFPYQGADEGNIPLPIDLASFNATVNERNVTLNWTTTWEVNNDRFEIQRRLNMEDAAWATIGSVNGSGTSYQTNNYSFIDKNLVTGKYEYRLVQYDYDGNSTADFTLTQVVEIGTPSRFDLSQNYPNPFNPVTKINIEIPVEGLVKLVIYDISGREVSSLINEVLTPGYYTADFNGEKLSSGVYFYRLITNNNSFTKRMVLIK